MIKQSLLAFLAVSMFFPIFGQEPAVKRPARRGENAGYGSRDATVLSMMGWGLGLGVGIATLCALIPSNPEGSGGGGGGHGH